MNAPERRGGNNMMTPQQAMKSGNVNALVKSMSAQLSAALPQHLRTDRFDRICVTALRRSPKLMQCTPVSLLGALMECAQMGLEPGVGQQIHLIPYGREVTVIIGYQGYVELARRAGITIHPPRVVREGDEFDVDWGNPERQVIHKPAFGVVGEMSHVWAMATGDTIAPVVEVMSRAQIEVVRDRARKGRRGSSPWDDHFEEMARKTVVRRLAKYLPKSSEFLRAEALDSRVVTGMTDSGAADWVVEADVVEEAPKKKTTRRKKSPAQGAVAAALGAIDGEQGQKQHWTQEEQQAIRSEEALAAKDQG